MLIHFIDVLYVYLAGQRFLEGKGKDTAFTLSIMCNRSIGFEYEVMTNKIMRKSVSLISKEIC